MLVVIVVRRVISIFFYLKLFYIIYLSKPEAPSVGMNPARLYLLTLGVLASVVGGVLLMLFL